MHQKNRNFAAVAKMMAESDKIMRKLKKKLGVRIKGEVYKGKPEAQFEEDIRKFQKKFEESTKEMKPKLEYYYGPYE